ncbi:hypothetical protein QUF84_21920 [Fictibacillus enclensis]|uniref:hypothetical protein n=1 Tax=Fictibacillus enclensis TaxID=1017270 RepID=UPI0025A1EA4F|nr:hypothetical protein [Fictibacillus enclensis]MDM5339857.1 hypothetical protein [Fictibacillus enclensis]
MTTVLNKEDPPLESSYFHFIFPFSMKEDCAGEAINYLKHKGYEFFSLTSKTQEKAYYGGNNKISHKELEHYFLPFTSDVLFPKKEHRLTFRRYSKATGITAELQSNLIKVPFTINSIDVFLLPFELGFITLRISIKDVSYSEAIEFAARFRVLENRTRDDRKAVVLFENETYQQVETFLFNVLLPDFTRYLDVGQVNGSHFESLPFFIDERMYVQVLFQFKKSAKLHDSDLFRGSQLDGLNDEGQPEISSSNKDYIHDYCIENGYHRWAPNTYYLIDEHVFSCMTNATGVERDNKLDQMYGEFYYGLLLNLFHKIVLLRLSNRYSQVHLEKDNEETEKLIGEITLFSARFFFLELAAQSQGSNIFIKLKEVLQNQELYDDVKQTLSTLYQYQDQKSAKRNNYLISILTIYTVITGIYGMNMVIQELKSPIKLSKISSFGFFEYLALFVTVTGIAASLLLGISFLKKWIRELRNRNGME